MANYKKEVFEGYTHRFKVEFETGEEYTSNMDIYSDSDSREDLEKFISAKKTKKVKSFKIVNRSTKEQDEKAGELIEETLKGI